MSQPDEVDQILNDWHNARPELDLAPLAIFSRLGRIAKHLANVRGTAFENSQLSHWEFDVLAVLRRTGHPHTLSPKRLVQETMVSSGTMTNRIDRMTERGLVRRLTDPNDGRGVRVEMTALGGTLVDEAMTRLSAAEEQLLKNLDKTERTQLSKLLRLLAASVENNKSVK